MEFNHSVAQISKYRTPLMGLATIWVSLFHFRCVMGVSPFGLFDAMGYGGVDIFLFLSGFGLYVGYKNDIKYFYKRRFLRIYPTYILVILIGTIIGGGTLLDAFVKSTGIGYYLPFSALPWFDWYVPTMYLLYLVFPLFIWCSYNYGIKKSVSAMVIIGICFTMILVFVQKGTIILTTSRIPVFFVGSLFGYFYKNIANIKTIPFNNFFYFGLLVFIIEFYLVYKLPHLTLWRFAIYWLPFVIIAPFICIGTTYVIEKSRRVNILLTFIGSISFEFFLVHIMLLPPFKDFFISSYPSFFNNYPTVLGLYIVFFFLSVLIALALSKTMTLVSSRILKTTT